MELYHLLIKPQFRLSSGLRSRREILFFYSDDETKMASNLPKMKACDPKTGFSQRLRVFSGKRFPNTALVVQEVAPLRAFLHVLFSEGVLNHTSITEAEDACKRHFSRYRPLVIGGRQMGYEGFPTKPETNMNTDGSTSNSINQPTSAANLDNGEQDRPLPQGDATLPNDWMSKPGKWRYAYKYKWDYRCAHEYF